MVQVSTLNVILFSLASVYFTSTFHCLKSPSKTIFCNGTVANHRKRGKVSELPENLNIFTKICYTLILFYELLRLFINKNNWHMGSYEIEYNLKADIYRTINYKTFAMILFFSHSMSSWKHPQKTHFAKKLIEEFFFFHIFHTKSLFLLLHVP